MPRKPEESRPINHPHIGPKLKELMTPAVACIKTALERQKGDRVATDLARWVLIEVAHGVEGAKAQGEHDDLAKTLHLLRGGKG